jgi:hypothetical protein
MAEGEDRADDIDENEKGGDDLCNEETKLEDDEIVEDDELPAASGGVEEGE